MHRKKKNSLLNTAQHYCRKLASDYEVAVTDRQLAVAVRNQQSKMMWRGNWNSANDIRDALDLKRYLDGMPKYRWPLYEAAIAERIRDYCIMPEGKSG